MLIEAERSCLLIVDVQAKLLPAMAAPEAVVANAAILMKAAARLEIPLLVSEQYPKGLGPTVPELAELAPAEAVVEKVHFSCLGDGHYSRRFQELGRTQAVIAGIEAHVCVLQTAMELIGDGHQVFIVGDAVSSRRADNASAALARLGAAGAAIVTAEMVIFEWLGRAGTPEFKELLEKIK